MKQPTCQYSTFSKPIIHYTAKFLHMSKSLLSTKNPDIEKCSLIDFIKGSKSMQFFAK